MELLSHIWAMVLFFQDLPSFIWVAVAFAFLPVVTAVPDEGHFPNVSFNTYNLRTNKGIFFSKQTVCLNISNIQDIGNIVIPFFDLYPVLGVKKMDYNDFKNIYNIILSKGHLSPEGLAQIQQIRNNMNDKRTVF